MPALIYRLAYLFNSIVIYSYIYSLYRFSRCFKTLLTLIFQDCSVVGLGNSQTDQRVAAVVVINPNKKTNMEDLLKWCNESMEEAEVMMMFKTT